MAVVAVAAAVGYDGGAGNQSGGDAVGRPPDAVVAGSRRGSVAQTAPPDTLRPPPRPGAGRPAASPGTRRASRSASQSTTASSY